MLVTRPFKGFHKFYLLTLKFHLLLNNFRTRRGGRTLILHICIALTRPFTWHHYFYAPRLNIFVMFVCCQHLQPLLNHRRKTSYFVCIYSTYDAISNYTKVNDLVTLTFVLKISFSDYVANRGIVFHKHMYFLPYALDLEIWPFFGKTLNLAITSKQKKIRLSFCTFIYLEARPYPSNIFELVTYTL